MGYFQTFYRSETTKNTALLYTPLTATQNFNYLEGRYDESPTVYPLLKGTRLQATAQACGHITSAYSLENEVQSAESICVSALLDALSRRVRVQGYHRAGYRSFHYLS